MSLNKETKPNQRNTSQIEIFAKLFLKIFLMHTVFIEYEKYLKRYIYDKILIFVIRGAYFCILF